jgi:signal transduction histidine kinase
MDAIVAVPPAAERVVRPPKPAVLWGIALAGLILAVLAAVFGRTNSEVDDQQMALYLWMIVPYTAAGLVAWWRRPQSRLGLLLIAGGLGTGLSALQFSHHSLPYTIGAALDLLPVALLLHVYLAFPDGLLRSRFERVLVGIAYPAAVGIQVFRLTLGSSDNLMEVGAATEVADDARKIGLVVLSGILLTGIGVLAFRRSRSGRGRRRALALVIDLCALGMLLAAALLLDAAFYGPHLVAIQRATWIVVGLAPIVFLIGLLDARLARSAVGDLIVELRTDLPPVELEDAVARTLRDPSLTLAYWLPDFETYVDLAGRPVEVPCPNGRMTTAIDQDGRHVAALLHDRELGEEPELLEAVRAAAGIALENGRLQAELAARLEEVKGSRARVIEAGQKERQRLERNLHDGAQQRLVALSLDLSLLGGELEAGSDARSRLDRARGEIAASLSELREIARGIHPAVVTGHGLAVALEQLTALAPVPVRLTVAIEDRLPDALEVAAYYLVSESLANIGKYAHATSATVEVTRANGQIVVEVTDDGVGGAETESGTGLRGLADRVEALDGRLRIWSPRGGGTRVRAEIPCVQ